MVFAVLKSEAYFCGLYSSFYGISPDFLSVLKKSLKMGEKIRVRARIVGRVTLPKPHKLIFFGFITDR